MNIPLPYSWYLDDYMSYKSLDETTITPSDLDEFLSSGWYDHEYRVPHCEDGICPHKILNEMLSSHEVKYLVDAIKKEFSKNYNRVISKYIDKGDVALVWIKKDIYNIESISLERIIDKHMWYCTSTYEGDDEYVVMVLEKSIAQDVTDYVRRQCHNIVYHVTHISNIPSINRTGIRSKGSNRSDKAYRANRYYPDRVYCLAAPTKETLREYIKKLKDDKGYRWEDLVIYKIDLRKYGNNLSFYSDPQSQLLGAVFTYALFPPKIIERVDPEKFFDLTSQK